MAAQYLDIEDVPEDLQKKVHQNLAFRTGSFVWRIKFNTPLNPSTVNASTMYLTNEIGAPVNANIQYNPDTNMIEIEPTQAYAEGVFYYLNISTKVRSRGGQQLKKPIRIKFKL